MSQTSRFPPLCIDPLHASFLQLLPRFDLHGRIVFRHLRCADTKQDCLCEMRALVWKWFLRLIERGKDPNQVSSALATFAARAVLSGRRLTGQERAKDALSHVAQRRRGFRVQTMSPSSVSGDSCFVEALEENHHTPPDEQAAFRIDWPSWLKTRTRRDRQMIHDLMMGERTTEVAKKYNISPGRISQLRQEYRADWLRFVEEPPHEECA